MQFALLGSSISYSLSPFIHQFLLHHHKIIGEYTIIDILPSDLSTDFLEKISPYTGLNITIPYKEEVLKYFSSSCYSPEVCEIQAANCIDFTGNTAVLHNTDAYGFIQPLRLYTSHEQKKVLILGNGGAMKAIRYALYAQYPEIEITVAARNQHTAAEIQYSDIGDLNISEYGLIINTTPVSPYQFTTLSEQTILYDLNYRDENCMFLHNHPNTIHINGITMLVYQAVKSFEIWHKCHVKKTLIDTLFKEIEVHYGIK